VSDLPARRDDVDVDLDRMVAGGFLSGYRNPTQTLHKTNLGQWFDWCLQHGLRPLSAERAHIQVWARELEEHRGLKPSTVANKVGTVAGFYKYAFVERYLEHNPAEHVRRPSAPRESTRESLSRSELLRMLECADVSGISSDPILVGLLGLLGLRIGEACAVNVEDIRQQGSYIALHVHREKGNRGGLVPLPWRLLRPIEAARRSYPTGPLLRMRTGERMDRKCAARSIARLTKAAGINKHITPHCLRHTAVTLSLDAGVSTRDIQNGMGYADQRMISYYDRSKDDLSRHHVHMLSAYVEGS
jgi:integrase/recombinase XerD